MGTIRLTAAVAVARYLAAQRRMIDGQDAPLFAGCVHNDRVRSWPESIRTKAHGLTDTRKSYATIRAVAERVGVTIAG